MKIGIFDSGVGGLTIARGIRKALPKYDYVYLGDTKRVPYGDKSHETVFKFTKEAVDYLFRKENCAIIIIACNTASARALRQIQQEYLPKNFKDRKVLGVLIPTAEVASLYKKVGIIATVGTVTSNTFPIEIKKLNQNATIFQNSTPLLVPLIEEGKNLDLAKPFLLRYLRPLLNKKIDALVLGCTHYPILKKEIKKIIPKNVKLISQEEIVPQKFKEYLKKHSEINKKLSKSGSMKILVTDQTPNVNRLVKKWFSSSQKIIHIIF
jgi:glutamate racemase